MGKAAHCFASKRCLSRIANGRKSKKNNGSQGAAVLCSPVKVAPSFVLSSQRISSLSFLLWHFDVEAVRCSWVLSCPPPQSGGPCVGLSFSRDLQLTSSDCWFFMSAIRRSLEVPQQAKFSTFTLCSPENHCISDGNQCWWMDYRNSERGLM